ncbi:MAG: hypothetical protein M5R42_13915 [Rhodocyclaceae bacterium]|nr:hypothetical protein [Rhodocyclaceae bacterium]
MQEVNRLLNQFEQTQKMMKQFSKGGLQKMMRGHERDASGDALRIMASSHAVLRKRFRRARESGKARRGGKHT